MHSSRAAPRWSVEPGRQSSPSVTLRAAGRRGCGALHDADGDRCAACAAGRRIVQCPHRAGAPARIRRDGGRLGANNEGAEGLRARRAAVVIPDESPHFEIEACIWHELTHVFGFQAHPVGIDSALLAERRLTRNDLVLLRTLYDPRLARGPRSEAMKRAREIIAEHVPTVQHSRDPLTALTQR